MIMKKKISLLGFVVVVAFAKAQPSQYFMQRSSTNVASMSEIQNLQVFLSGTHSFVGFEGSPKSILLNVAVPIAGNRRAGNYQKQKKSKYGEPGFAKNFVGGTLSNETFGIHFNFQTSFGYAYRFWLSERANLTLGLSAGMKQTGSNYDKIKDGYSPIQSNKETDFLFQFGSRFEMNKLSISAFGNENNLCGEIVFGRLWDYGATETSQNYYYEDKQKAWYGQLSAMYTHNKGSKTNLFRFSVNAVYRDGLCVGISYQTNKDLSANVGLRFTKSLRIGYAYGLLQLNPVAPKHEIALRYRLVRDVD